MTCRKPTISVRMDVLQRLAQANADAPESRDYAPVSWSELDRTSFTEGLEELLAHQRERVEAEQQRSIFEAHERAKKRERQRRLAQQWEQELIEKSRQRDLQRRVADAKKRAQQQADDELSAHRAQWTARMHEQAVQHTWEREMTAGTVERSKKLWGRGLQVLVAAAALTALIWGSAFSRAQSQSSDEIARVWEDKQAQEIAAVTRVSELEAEIDRRVNLSESERAWLETELSQARLELAAAEKEREEVDQRRPRPQPRRLVQTIKPVESPTFVDSKSVDAEDSSAQDSVRVAADELYDDDGCLPYDPLCFEL